MGESTIIGKSVFKNINEVIPLFGPFGRFQQLVTAIFCLMIIPSTYQVLIMYFASLKPDWKCAANSSVCVLNGTLTSTNKFRCSIPRNDWEYTEQDSYSIITQFDIYCEKEWQIHLTTSILFIGWMFGAVFLGWFADNYGRKIVLFPSCFIVIIVGFISAFSPNIQMLVVCRFIIGFFTPGNGVQMVILLSEFVSTKFRPLAVCLVWFFFSIALCLLGLKAYYIREWKILIIVCSIPYIFIMLFYKFIPESIRWLHVHEKMDHLMEVLQRISFWNKKKIPDDFKMLPLETVGVKHKANPLDVFRPRRMAVKTLIQGYAWLVNGMVYYGLSLAADDLGGNLYTNYILLSAIEFPANLLTIYLCERIGRKKTVAGNMALGGVACIVVAFVPSIGGIKILRIILGCVGKWCITISFNAIYTWSIEIYPTDIRAEGMGFLQITSRIGAASSPWIAKGLKGIHHFTPFIVMGVLSVAAAISLIWLPETQGKPAPDTDGGETSNNTVEGGDNVELMSNASIA